MKFKPKFSTLLVLLLLLAGLGVMLFPTFSDLLARREMSEELAQYNRVIEGKKADYSEMWTAAEEYNQYLASKESQFFMEDGERDWIGTLLNPLGNGMMGTVEIPKINVDIPIYQGTDETQLQSGAGWLFGSSLPTGGESTHCVITAHNGLVKAKLFTDLEQLELGDTFTVTVLDRVLTYEVDAINVTEPEDYSLLAVVPGADLVTLYTCTPYGVNTHRLLVTGHRIPTPETEEPQLPIPVPESSSPIWLLLPLAAALLIALLILRRYRRRYRGKRVLKNTENLSERRRGSHENSGKNLGP